MESHEGKEIKLWTAIVATCWAKVEAVWHHKDTGNQRKPAHRLIVHRLLVKRGMMIRNWLMGLSNTAGRHCACHSNYSEKSHRNHLLCPHTEMRWKLSIAWKMSCQTSIRVFHTIHSVTLFLIGWCKCKQRWREILKWNCPPFLLYLPLLSWWAPFLLITLVFILLLLALIPASCLLLCAVGRRNCEAHRLGVCFCAGHKHDALWWGKQKS